MKKGVLSILLLALFVSFTYSQESSENRFKSRPNLKLGLFSPSDDYLYTKNSNHVNTQVVNAGLNFQVGNHFYIGPTVINKFRFGLDVTWLDLSVASLKESELDVNSGAVVNIGLLGVGPLASFSPARDLVIDAYLKVLPTVSVLGFSDEKDDSYTYSGYGATSVIGAAFRWRILTTGIEFNGGHFDMKDNDDDNNVIDNSVLNNFRVYIGLQF